MSSLVWTLGDPLDSGGFLWTSTNPVIPAKAGIQERLDARLRGHDGQRQEMAQVPLTLPASLGGDRRDEVRVVRLW